MESGYWTLCLLLGTLDVCVLCAILLCIYPMWPKQKGGPSRGGGGETSISHGVRGIKDQSSYFEAEMEATIPVKLTSESLRPSKQLWDDNLTVQCSSAPYRGICCTNTIKRKL